MAKDLDLGHVRTQMGNECKGDTEFIQGSMCRNSLSSSVSEVGGGRERLSRQEWASSVSPKVK